MDGSMEAETAGVVAISLRSQVEDRLRRSIIKGQFAPGAHLSDRALCELFNVSRTVVREAIRQMEAEGLVKSVPHRGAFVKILTLDEARQVYSVREALEALAAKEFTLNASDDQIGELATQIERLRVAVRNNSDVLKQKEAFYALLLAGTRNAYLTMMLGQILNWTTQLRTISLSLPQRLAQSMVELDQLLAAIQNRDPEAAHAASTIHVKNAAAAALPIVERRERDSSQTAAAATAD